MTFFWGCVVFLSGCDIFCGWLWVGVIFFFLDVGGCDIFLFGCGWV